MKVTKKNISIALATLLSAGAIGTGVGIGAQSKIDKVNDANAKQLGEYVASINNINEYSSQIFNSDKAIIQQKSVEEPVATPNDIGLRDLKFNFSGISMSDYYNGYHTDGKDPYIDITVKGSVNGLNAKNETVSYKSCKFSVKLDYENYKYYEDICNSSSKYKGVKPHWYSEEKGNLTCENDDAKMYNISAGLEENESVEEKTTLMNAIYQAIEVGEKSAYAILDGEKKTAEKVTTTLVNIGSPEVNKDEISYTLTIAKYDANNYSKDAKLVQATLNYSMTEDLKKEPFAIYDDEIIEMVVNNIANDKQISNYTASNKPSFTMDYSVSTIKDCSSLIEMIANSNSSSNNQTKQSNSDFKK